MSEPANHDVETPSQIEYDPSSSHYDIYECVNCDNVVLVLGRDDPPMACHDEPMERVTDCNIAVQPPDIREVLLNAFGLPKAGLDICHCVIGKGPLSASEVAKELDYDRSTITRYLNKLVELGLLDRSELNREEGGIVNVYHSIDLERMRRDTLIGFYVWAGEAGSRLEDAHVTKQNFLEANPDQSLPKMFWESSSEQ